jgi:hypothetical protein
LLRVAYGKDPVTGKPRRKTWTFEAHGLRAAERQAARLIDSYEQDGIIGTRASVEQLLEEFMRFSISRGRSLRDEDHVHDPSILGERGSQTKRDSDERRRLIQRHDVDIGG